MQSLSSFMRWPLRKHVQPAIGHIMVLVAVTLACATPIVAIHAASWLSTLLLWPSMKILPAAVISAGSFFLAQVLLPRCRFRLRPLISPLNWFLCMFFLQLVLVPMVVSLAGPSAKFLPFMPSDSAINIALLLVTLAFWSFCGAIQIFHKKHPAGVMEKSRPSARSWFPPRWLILVYAILGMAGIVLRFGSFGHLVDYFMNPQSYLISSQEEGGNTASLAGAASTFLLSFSSFSVILLWCRGVSQERQRKGSFSQVREYLLVVLIAVLTPLYGYNRATFVIPMIGLAAVMTKRRLSSNFFKVLAVGALVTFVVFTISSYRMQGTNEGSAATNNINLDDMFQDYGAAPQYLGFLLQGTDYAKDLGMGRILLSSALSPLPILGKPFRDDSGRSIYDELIGRNDQPPTFVGELFLDFHVFGVIFGFLAVGFLAAILQNRFEVATEPFEVFVLQFASLWFSYFVVSSLEVVSQTAVDFSWPIYGFLLYRMFKQHGSLQPIRTGNWGTLSPRRRSDISRAYRPF